MLADLAESALIVVDIQPSFLNGIDRGDRVLSRSEFLVRAAGLLGVPILATEQYPSRMGGTHESLVPVLTESRALVAGKMKFSCVGCAGFDDWMLDHRRQQVVLVGIETHICVNQTMHHLRQSGKEVFVAADAVGAR